MKCPKCSSKVELDTGYDLELRVFCTNLDLIPESRLRSGERYTCAWQSQPIRSRNGEQATQFEWLLDMWLEQLDYDDMFDKFGQPKLRSDGIINEEGK